MTVLASKLVFNASRGNENEAITPELYSYESSVSVAGINLENFLNIEIIASPLTVPPAYALAPVLDVGDTAISEAILKQLQDIYPPSSPYWERFSACMAKGTAIAGEAAIGVGGQVAAETGSIRDAAISAGVVFGAGVIVSGMVCSVSSLFKKEETATATASPSIAPPLGEAEDIDSSEFPQNILGDLPISADLAGRVAIADLDICGCAQRDITEDVTQSPAIGVSHIPPNESIAINQGLSLVNAVTGDYLISQHPGILNSAINLPAQIESSNTRPQIDTMFLGIGIGAPGIEPINLLPPDLQAQAAAALAAYSAREGAPA